MRKSFSSDNESVIISKEMWYIPENTCWVCDGLCVTLIPAHSQQSMDQALERKRGEPFWCTEIIGFAHNLAICYLLKFPPLPCQDKSGNIHRTQSPAAETWGVLPKWEIHWVSGGFLYTGSWGLWSGLSPNWSCWMSEVQSSFQKGAGWVIVLYIVKAEMQHNVLCKQSFIRHKIQVLGNDFQSWF